MLRQLYRHRTSLCSRSSAHRRVVSLIQTETLYASITPDIGS
jgi:hypothetical protein